MARRKRGRPVHGWLILDKPAGITSAAAVARARWALDARKAGHAGTLDPAATGLLAIAFGEATKTVPVLTDARKTYRFTAAWGAATSTDDAEGAVLARSDTRPTRAAIEAALPAFRGEIVQVPPQVSAVKVAGRRAYARAREGETLDLAARPLAIHRLDLIETPDADSAVFEMVCGKGGYVRSLARDLGAALGCLGHVRNLRRLTSGPFDIAQALDWCRLDRAEPPDNALRPVAAALAGLPRADCDGETARRLANGNPVCLPGPDGPGWVADGGRPLALGRWEGGHFTPDRVFVFD